MKKLFTLFVIAIMGLNIFAQAPQKMSYQCVVRNSSGVLVANHAVGMKVSILQGSASGTVVFSETYSPAPQTNANGLVTVEIGSGTPVTGTFTGINWASGPYYLKTETDPAGGTSYTIVGTSQLLSVPYSLYAKTAGNGSLWTLNGANIYYNAGKVGIGIIDPLAPLHVNESIIMGIGDKKLTLFTQGTGEDIMSTNTLHLNHSNNQNVSIGEGGTSNLFVSGKVGIGTTAPGSLLQVHSNTTYAYGITPIIRISDNYKAWNIGLGSSGDRFTIASEDLTERLAILKSNGYVGIGPTTPAYKLDVAGNLNIINGRYGDALWCNGSQALWWDGTYFSWGYGGTYNYFADPITIGNVTNPTGYALWVQGNAWSTGAFLSSDARYKKNISEIENPLDKIMKIRGTSFEFRSDEFKDYQFAEGPQFGFIAQELENVFPEVVKTENDGYKSVNYSGMIPVLLESIKEQQLQIESQQKQIDELKQAVELLKP